MTTRTTHRMRVAGVPEHMNLPWQLAIDDGVFTAGGYELSWRSEPGGTGALAAALDSGACDIATLLTEGAVAAIGRGGRFRIVSWWLTSPLVWGIHVAGRNGARTLASFGAPRFAISRRGSGSHLMAFVLARREHLPLGEFVEVGDLDGARRALGDGRADMFLWERAMTSPLVDAGEFARIGTMPTAWPSFVVAAGTGVLADHARAVAAITAAALRAARDFARRPDAAEVIATRLGISHDEAAAWLATARWAERVGAEPTALDAVQRELQRAGALGELTDPHRLLQRIAN